MKAKERSLSHNNGKGPQNAGSERKGQTYERAPSHWSKQWDRGLDAGSDAETKTYNGGAYPIDEWDGSLPESEDRMKQHPQVSTRRIPRKIRYYDHEWDRVVAQARACRLPPATFVRKVSLGARPSASQGEDKLVLELGRVATELQNLAQAAEYGDPPEPGQIQLILDETLTAVRRVGER